MHKVWAVSEGSYSDYHVMALFEQKADAKRFADRYRGFYRNPIWAKDVRVEGFELYGPSEFPEPLVEYAVEVDSEGGEVDRWERRCWPWDYPGDESIDVADGHVRAWSTRGYDVALKSARDRLYQRKARKEGV